MAILGIDEVGRGPLAGPLVVGAVILPEFSDEEVPEWILSLKDSKKLSAKKRETLNKEIIVGSVATGLGWVFVKELDALGISEALRLATRRAVKTVQSFHKSFSQIVIDGKVNFLADTALEKFVSTMPKADDLIREVSAASIIAKVARDHYMMDLAKKFPNYGFESNVGYGTAQHLAAINKYGITLEHRKSFEPIKSMVGFERTKNVVKNTTYIGNKGETAVVDYLIHNSHKIIERNYKTKIAEIDIVSVKDNKIYFTEVKYRKSDFCGGGLAAITKEKQRRMRLAAECYIKYKKEFANFLPLLAVANVAGENFKVKTWFTLDS